MAFDPNEHPRASDGKFTNSGSAGVEGQSKSAKSAAEWLRSDEAKKLISKMAAPENIKKAATMAIQGALFKIGVNDPHIDQAIEHQVRSFANDIKVTRAHARQLMLTAVKALRNR